MVLGTWTKTCAAVSKSYANSDMLLFGNRHIYLRGKALKVKSSHFILSLLFCVFVNTVIDVKSDTFRKPVEDPFATSCLFTVNEQHFGDGRFWQFFGFDT